MTRSELEKHVADMIWEHIYPENGVDVEQVQDMTRAAIAAVLEKLPNMVTDELIEIGAKAAYEATSRVYGTSWEDAHYSHGEFRRDTRTTLTAVFAALRGSE